MNGLIADTCTSSVKYLSASKLYHAVLRHQRCVRRHGRLPRQPHHSCLPTRALSQTVWWHPTCLCLVRVKSCRFYFPIHWYGLHLVQFLAADLCRVPMIPVQAMFVPHRHMRHQLTPQQWVLVVDYENLRYGAFRIMRFHTTKLHCMNFCTACY